MMGEVFNIGVAVSANLIRVVASAALTMVNLYLRTDEIHHLEDAVAWIDTSHQMF